MAADDHLQGELFYPRLRLGAWSDEGHGGSFSGLAAYTGRRDAPAPEAPEQLRMFMRASEIKEQYQPNPADRRVNPSNIDPPNYGKETAEEMYDRKLRQASGTHQGGYVYDKPLREVLATGPVPGHISINLENDTIAGGHHRTAVFAADKPDDYLPVVHYKDWRQAISDPRYE